MTTIHNEVTIDLGDTNEELLTFWVISHGGWPESDVTDRWAIFVEALYHLCAREGWLIECNEETLNDDRSLAIFA